jgi:cytochrome c553
MIPRKGASLAALALLSAGCADLSPRESRFEQTGEVIALSGGDAGARGACVTCHGLKGEGDGHLAPRLAGLDPGYFARQMEYYAKGLRRHEQMVWIAKRMDGPARKKLARYYAALPVPQLASATPQCIAVKLYHEGDPARGLEPCAACHGADGRGTRGNPPVADQPAPYMAEQLRQWRDGERYGDPMRAMYRISRALTDAERSALAGYNPARRGATPNPRLPEACLRTRRPDPRRGA